MTPNLTLPVNPIRPSEADPKPLDPKDKDTYHLGELVIIDNNKDGDYDRGIDSVMSADSYLFSNALSLSSGEVSTLNKFYKIDLNSTRQWKLRPAEQYFWAASKMGYYAGVGDESGVLEQKKLAAHFARRNGIRPSPADINSIKIKTLSDAVEGHLKNAANFANYGFKMEMDESLASARDVAGLLKSKYGVEIKIDGDRHREIFERYVKSYNAKYKDYLQVVPELKQIFAYVKAKGWYPEMESSLREKAREMANDLMMTLERNACRDFRIDEIETGLGAVRGLLEDTGIQNPQDLLRLEEIRRVVYLKAAQHEFEKNRWNPLLGIGGGEVADYAAELGLSWDEAIQESYLLDAEKAAEQGDVKSTARALNRILDLDGPEWIRDFLDIPQRDQMNAIHQKALNKAIVFGMEDGNVSIGRGEMAEAQEILTQVLDHAQVLEDRYGIAAGETRSQVKQMWEQRYTRQIEDLLKKAESDAKLGFVKSADKNILEAHSLAIILNIPIDMERAVKIRALAKENCKPGPGIYFGECE